MLLFAVSGTPIQHPTPRNRIGREKKLILYIRYCTLSTFQMQFVDAVVGLDQPIADLFRPLSKSSGLDLVTLRFLVGLFLAYPIAFVHKSLLEKFHNHSLRRNLTSTAVRHVFSLAGGVFLTFLVHGFPGFSHSCLALCLIARVFHIFLTSFVSFVSLHLLSARIASKFVFFWTFAYLSAMHIHRQWFHYLEDGADMTGNSPLFLLILIFSWPNDAHDQIDHSSFQLG